MISLHGNWVDLIILSFILFYSKQGMKRGFLILIAEIASFIFAFTISFHFYPLASTFLSSSLSLSHNLANTLGFVLIVFLSQNIISRLFTQLYKQFPKEIFHSNWNLVLGFLPGIIDGLILCAFITTAIIALPVNPSLKENILSSQIGSKLVSVSNSFEFSLNKVFGKTILDNLSFLTVKSGSTQNINLHFHTNNFALDSASENTMFKLVNQERLSHNLPPLSLDASLIALARSHSGDMLSKGYFSHIDPDGNDPFDRMRSSGIAYQTAGENLAYAPSVQIAHTGLMNSPEHRANILNPDFGHLGIGVIDAGVYGKMFTQEFTN